MCRLNFFQAGGTNPNLSVLLQTNCMCPGGFIGVLVFSCYTPLGSHKEHHRGSDGLLQPNELWALSDVGLMREPLDWSCNGPQMALLLCMAFLGLQTLGQFQVLSLSNIACQFLMHRISLCWPPTVFSLLTLDPVQKVYQFLDGNKWRCTDPTITRFTERPNYCYRNYYWLL